MAKRTPQQPKSKQISTREGVITGIMLLGQISGILAGFAIGGFLFDQLFNSTPIGLALGVVIGSLWATFTVLRKVRKEIEITGEDDVKDVEPKQPEEDEEDR